MSVLNTFSKLIYPAVIYLLKVNKNNTIVICETYLKLTIKAPERRHWRRYRVFIVNLEQIFYIVLVFHC